MLREGVRHVRGEKGSGRGCVNFTTLTSLIMTHGNAGEIQLKKQTEGV